MAKSIMWNKPYCMRCGTTRNLQVHHVFNGLAYRKKCDEDGLTIMLCAECHDYIHHTSKGKKLLIKYKENGEKLYLLKIGSYEMYKKRYINNYLEQSEIEDCERRSEWQKKECSQKK